MAAGCGTTNAGAPGSSAPTQPPATNATGPSTPTPTSTPLPTPTSTPTPTPGPALTSLGGTSIAGDTASNSDNSFLCAATMGEKGTPSGADVTVAGTQGSEAQNLCSVLLAEPGSEEVSSFTANSGPDCYMTTADGLVTVRIYSYYGDSPLCQTLFGD